MGNNIQARLAPSKANASITDAASIAKQLNLTDTQLQIVIKITKRLNIKIKDCSNDTPLIIMLKKGEEFIRFHEKWCKLTRKFYKNFPHKIWPLDGSLQYDKLQALSKAIAQVPDVLHAEIECLKFWQDTARQRHNTLSAAPHKILLEQCGADKVNPSAPCEEEEEEDEDDDLLPNDFVSLYPNLKKETEHDTTHEKIQYIPMTPVSKMSPMPQPSFTDTQHRGFDIETPKGTIPCKQQRKPHSVFDPIIHPPTGDVWRLETPSGTEAGIFKFTRDTTTPSMLPTKTRAQLKAFYRHQLRQEGEQEQASGATNVLPLRQIALPGEEPTEPHISEVYVPWKPNEIRSMVSDLPQINLCPRKWLIKIGWLQKTQRATYGDLWILIDCAIPDKYIDSWKTQAAKKGATEDGVKAAGYDNAEKNTEALLLILKDWVLTYFNKGQDLRKLMEVVQKKGEDVLDYWKRFKEAVQSYTDWDVEEVDGMDRAELVSSFVGGLLAEIREEVELRTPEWRKRLVADLVDIAQNAYDILITRKEKIEKKEKAKLMNLQVQKQIPQSTDNVKKSLPPNTSIPVSTVQVSPQGMPVTSPPYPPSGVVYISNYDCKPPGRVQQPYWNRGRGGVNSGRYQHVVPQAKKSAGPECYTCGRLGHIARNCTTA